MSDDERQRAISANKHQAQKSNKQRPTLNQVSPAVAVRDEKRCQITRGGEMGCEVAHIIPTKLDGNALTWDDLMEIWDWLEAFWGTEKVAKWKGLISEDWELCVHQVHNLITLNMKIHHFWDHGLVALRPIWINEEQTEMKISFHWLPLEELKGRSQKETVWMTAYPLKDPKFRPKNTSGGHYIAILREDG